MANLTITVDAKTLRRARARALERGTSVNAVLSDYLLHFAGDDPAEQAMGRFLDLAASAGGSSGPAGRTWTRDDIHDRSILRRH
jgi:hypothetical protein